MRRRDRLVMGGLVAFAVALLASFVPGVGAAIPIEPVVDLLGSDYLLVAVVGVLALAATVGMASRRAATTVSQATPPDPEGVLEAPAPGAAFDDRLAEPFELPSLLAGRSRADVRERLREAATLTHARAEGCSREAAEGAVQAGQWTDDPTAAMFLRRRPPAPSFEERLHAALHGDTWFQHAARETALAVAREAGVEPGRSTAEAFSFVSTERSADVEADPDDGRLDRRRVGASGGRHV